MHENLKVLTKAFDDKLAKEVAVMIATSHEYKTPNLKAGLHFTKNYDWQESTVKIANLQGINKPIIEEKVDKIANGIKKTGEVSPFVVVNQLDAIRPQTPGKKILIDGHHRLEACKKLGVIEVPVYLGTYHGGAHKSIEELSEKTAAYLKGIEKLAELKKDVKFNPYQQRVLDNPSDSMIVAHSVGSGKLLPA